MLDGDAVGKAIRRKPENLHILEGIVEEQAMPVPDGRCIVVCAQQDISADYVHYYIEKFGTIRDVALSKSGADHSDEQWVVTFDSATASALECRTYQTAQEYDAKLIGMLCASYSQP